MIIEQAEIMSNSTLEKLNLTPKQAREIIFDDAPEEFEVIENKITGVTRWSVLYRIVIRRLSDGKFFADTYSRAATEYQDEKPYEYYTPTFTEVFEVKKTVIVYE